MNWFKGLAGLAAALTLVALPGVSAAQSGRQQAVDAQADDLTAWLAQVATVGQGFNDILSRRVDTLLWLMEEPAKMLDLLDAGDKAAASAWAANWSAQARARLRGEVDAYNRLPRDLPAFPRSVSLTPAQTARIESMTQLPLRIGTLLNTTGQSSESYIRLVEAAASGRPDDMVRLAKGITTLISAQLEAENIMLEGARTDPSSPNHHFATSQIESNNAVIVLMRHQQAVILQQTSDPVQAAVRIRGHAANVRVAVQEMRRTIDSYQRRLSADPAFAATELATIFDAVFASFRESATVEARIADELDGLANAVEHDDAAAMDTATTGIETLVNRRIALDAERRALLAGG